MDKLYWNNGCGEVAPRMLQYRTYLTSKNVDDYLKMSYDTRAALSRQVRAAGDEMTARSTAGANEKKRRRWSHRLEIGASKYWNTLFLIIHCIPAGMCEWSERTANGHGDITHIIEILSPSLSSLRSPAESAFFDRDKNPFFALFFDIRMSRWSRALVQLTSTVMLTFAPFCVCLELTSGLRLCASAARAEKAADEREAATWDGGRTKREPAMHEESTRTLCAFGRFQGTRRLFEACRMCHRCFGPAARLTDLI